MQDSFVLEVDLSKTGAADGDQILFGGFQVEEGSFYSTYCDGDQGTGYIWTGGSNSSSSIRNDAVIQYPVSSSSQLYLDSDTGSVGFWLKAEWDAGNSALRYLFDTASGSSNKRLSIYKDTDNKLNMKIAEPGGDYAAIVTDQAVDWHPQDEWVHIACTYDFIESSSSWSLQAFVNGSPVSTSSTGTASTSSALPDYMYIGCSYEEEDFADGCFDDFFTYDKVLPSVEVGKIFNSPIQLTEGILRATVGSDTTDASAGTESSVAHGLGETPSFIEITEKGAGVVYLSNTADNQYFYVKSTAASINFGWRAWK